ncbi:MAG TPA: hypothetical protein VMH79_15270 [Thermoanaerobaculia bacterium]|nr:hypothetical protein [Thermoanaerobaculia bacterium]
MSDAAPVRLAGVRPVVVAAVAVAAALLAGQLLVPPIVGLANNGDFERVLGPVGLRAAATERSEKYFSWVVRRFEEAPAGWYPTGLKTSETLLARVAKSVSRPFEKDGAFDLRWLGALHALLLVAGLGLLLSATEPLPPGARWTAAVLLVFVFTDVGYAAPLNSFYSQAASLVFLLPTLGLLARGVAFPERAGPAWAAAWLAFAVGYSGSKPQEALQGLLLAAFAVRVAAVSGRPRKAAIVSAAALLAAFSLWDIRQTPPEIADVARYHKVFMELLPSSPEPERDLRDLGLDPSWVSAVGKSAYLPSSPFQDPAFRAAFLGRFSYTRLLGFYAAHPDRLVETVRSGGREALRLRHPRFGNLEHREGVPPGAKASAFSLWSGMRLALPGHPLLWIGALWAATLAAVAASWRRASPRGRLAREGLVLLVAMAALAFSICVLSNAHGDLARHFYVFHALTDLLLVADAVWLAAALASRRVVPAAAS